MMKKMISCHFAMSFMCGHYPEEALVTFLIVMDVVYVIVLKRAHI